MKVKELIEILKKYPENMPVKIMPDHERDSSFNYNVQDLTTDHLMQHSEKAWIDDEADPETWDCEDGKVRQKGKRYLLVNPIIT